MQHERGDEQAQEKRHLGKKGWCFTKQGKWGGVMIDPVALDTFEKIRATDVGIALSLD